MRRPSAVLPLLLLLVTAMPSVLTATRLSLPSIPDFRLPSGGSVNTVFPAATGGAATYTYSLSGQPPGISFAAGTRRASGTLPTVSSATTYTVTYGVSDSLYASASVTFTTTLTAPPPTSRPVSPPGPPPRPADPPTAPVDALRVHTLPLSVSETGEGEKEYRFRLQASTRSSSIRTAADRGTTPSRSASRPRARAAAPERGRG